MGDPCERLRERSAAALEELTEAGELLAKFSVGKPHQGDLQPGELEEYLRQMAEAFERERVAWEAYYQINLELLECIREANRERRARSSL
jgi:hypothetical protein